MCGGLIFWDWLFDLGVLPIGPVFACVCAYFYFMVRDANPIEGIVFCARYLLKMMCRGSEYNY